MAYKDVKQYYTKVEATYLEMLHDSREFDELLKGGYLTQEQIDNAYVIINKLKQNYERLSYIMYLFNAPNRPQKKRKYNYQGKKISSSLTGLSADENSVLNENKDILRNFKEYIKELKEHAN